MRPITQQIRTAIKDNGVNDALLILASELDSIRATATIGQKVVIKRQDRIDYILTGICDYYKITLDELSQRSRSKRKNIAIKILRDYGDIPLVDIARSVDQTSLPNLSRSLIRINHALSPDSYGNTDLKRNYEAVLKHLGL